MRITTDNLVIISTGIITVSAMLISPHSGINIAKYVVAGLIGYIGRENVHHKNGGV